MAAELRSTYGIGKHTALGFEQALSAVRAALADQGFGVLTEVDVQQTLRQKRGLTSLHRILGACHPVLAKQALRLERDAGLLLPCNVAVYEDESGVVVAALDPDSAFGIVAMPPFTQSRRRLERAFSVPSSSFRPPPRRLDGDGSHDASVTMPVRSRTAPADYPRESSSERQARWTSSRGGCAGQAAPSTCRHGRSLTRSRGYPTPRT